MRNALFLGAAAAAMLLAQHSFAGEIVITGRFQPNYTTGYVDTSFDWQFGDTSGDQYGDAVYFSNSALFAAPKIVTLADTPAYGTISETFTTLATLLFTPAGEFYQLVGPTGWLAVNIVYPGHGISSFSFVDYGVTAPPSVDPPPPCLTCDPPPPPSAATPEPSTWLMLSIGFGFLTLWRRHWLFPIRRRFSI